MDRTKLIENAHKPNVDIKALVSGKQTKTGTARTDTPVQTTKIHFATELA